MHTDTNQHSDLAQQVFSPEQFIYRQKAGKSQLEQRHKPAISFQQQQFQNAGSLTVTNSHVTVTTHTAAGAVPQKNGGNNNNLKTNSNNASNKKFSSKPRDTYGYAIGTSSTTQKPLQSQYSFYNTPVDTPSTSQQLPKRIPLLPLSIVQHEPPSGHPGVAQIPSFRLPAQGFRLPIATTSPLAHTQEHQSTNVPFEGYQRQLPPQVIAMKKVASIGFFF